MTTHHNDWDTLAHRAKSSSSSTFSSEIGALPSSTVPNPREHINSITTRSGLTTAEPSIPPPVPLIPREEFLKKLEILERIAQDVIVGADKFNFLANFVVVDFEADPRVPIILGRPFLRSKKAIVDLYEETLTLRVRNEQVVFYTNKSSRNNSRDIQSVHCINIIDFLKDKPISSSTTFSSDSLLGSSFPSSPLVDTSDSLLEEFADELALLDPFPPRNKDDNFDPEADLREIEYLLNRDPSIDSSPTTDIDIVNPILERFTDEPSLVYSSPSGDDDDDLFDLKSDNKEWKKLLYGDLFDNTHIENEKDKYLKIESLIDNMEDDLFDLKFDNDEWKKLFDSALPEESSESSDIDTLLSSPFGNEDKVFNPCILILGGTHIFNDESKDKDFKVNTSSKALLILKERWMIPTLLWRSISGLRKKKARRRGKVYNWETATYAIVFNDTLTPEALLCKPIVSSLNNDEIDFRISFEESDDEDCTIFYTAYLNPMDTAYRLSGRYRVFILSTVNTAYLLNEYSVFDTGIHTAYPGEWIQRIDFLYSFRPKEIILNLEESKRDDHFDDVPSETPGPRGGCKSLGCKWIFKRKMKVDGTIDKFKARLVIQGFRQKEGIDYFDTYAPVARITTIRFLLALAAIHNLVIHQIDVKTAFLNGDLDKEVYMKQPEGFVMPGNEHKFSMKDMGEVDVILGIRIKHENKGIVITQSHYIEKILKKFNREDCSSVSTPMDPVEKLKPNTVCRLSRFTSNPSRQHWQAITRVFKYLKGTMNYGLSYMGYPSVLEGYSDASWINHVEDSSSMSGWVFLLGGGAISWASKKQTCITGSTMESEFVALAAAGKEAEWLRNLIHEIPIWPKPIAPISIRCDSAPTMAKDYSQIYNGKSRHLGVRHCIIRELVMNGVIYRLGHMACNSVK
ncbi:zinc finger, CCHC-type containing protein [Tanacetum coccineum]